MSDPKRTYRRQSGPCEADGCDRAATTGGLCVKHYNRVRRHGTPADRPRKRPPKPCQMNGCGGHAIARGLCTTHYGRRRRHGDPDLAPDYGRGAGSGRETLPPPRWTGGWGRDITLIELVTDWRATSHIQGAAAERWRVNADGTPLGWLVTRDNGTRRFTYETPGDIPGTIRPFDTITRSKAVENLLAALNL